MNFLKRIKNFIKQKKKRTILTSLAIVGTIGGVFGITYAYKINTEVDSAAFGYYIQNNNTGRHHYTGYKKGEDGLLAYCLEPNKASPHGQDFAYDGGMDGTLFEIICNGYPYKHYMGVAKADYFATQLAVWEYTGALTGEGGLNNFTCKITTGDYTGQECNAELTNNGVKIDDALIKSTVQKIISNAQSSSKTQTAYITMNQASIEMGELNKTQKADGFESPNLYVMQSGDYYSAADKDNLTISFVDNSVGAVFVKPDGTTGSTLTGMKILDNFKIKVPGGLKTSGTVTYKVTGKAGVWVGGCYYVGGATQKMGLVWPQESNNDVSTEGYISWGVPTEDHPPDDLEGSIVIIKNDENGEPLAGASFSLYKKDTNEFIANKTSGGNGRIIFDKLKLGQYYVKETKAPKGYKLISESKNIEITERHPDEELPVENKLIKGSVTVYKTGEDGHPLKGAVFEIFGSDGKSYGKQTTDSAGKAIWDELPMDTYTIKEVSAPKGYQITSERFTCQITESQLHGKVTVSNEVAKGSITILKINELGRTLEDAEFTIYNSDGEALETKKTLSNGEVIFDHLPLGVYTIEETNPPEGYVPLKVTKTVEITESKPDGNIQIENEKIVGSLKITKRDGETNILLKDAIFALYDEDGTEITTVRIDSYGKGSITGIPYGHYILKEIAAPNGYALDQTEHEIFIEEKGQVITLDLKNYPIKYKIKVHKIDGATRESLKNATFQLWQSGAPLSYNGKTDFTTDQNGELVFPFDLAFGSYELLEVKAPYGYIPAERINIHLDESSVYTQDSIGNRYINLTVSNMQETYHLYITKLDANTEQPLQNAKYKIWNEDETEVLATGETGPTGIVHFPLPLGTYWYQEYEAPEGYQLDDTKYKVTFVEHEQTIKVKALNKSYTGSKPSSDVSITKEDFPMITISKKDAETGELLANAAFVIYAEDGTTVLKQGMTDATGTVTFQLESGNYYYQEISAPSGYLIDDTKYPFTLDGINDHQEAVLTNKRDVPETPSPPSTPGKVCIAKTDISTGALLPNAEFVIYASDGTTILHKAKTDEQGMAWFELPPGDYFYREFAAPKGYMVDDTKFPFSIKEWGEIVKCQMTDIPITNLPNTGSFDTIKEWALPASASALFCVLAVGLYLHKRRT